MGWHLLQLAAFLFFIRGDNTVYKNIFIKTFHLHFKMSSFKSTVFYQHCCCQRFGWSI